MLAGGVVLVFLDKSRVEKQFSPTVSLLKSLSCYPLLPLKVSSNNISIPLYLPIHLQSSRNPYLALEQQTGKAWCPLLDKKEFSELTHLNLDGLNRVSTRSLKNRNFFKVGSKGICTFTSTAVGPAETFSFTFDGHFYLNLFSCYNSKYL